MRWPGGFGHEQHGAMVAAPGGGSGTAKNCRGKPGNTRDIAGEDDEARLRERARRRQEHSRAIVEEIRQRALAQRALPRSSLGRAIGYLFEL